MKYIYLDTCHIQKIKESDYSELRQLLGSGDLTLVFSQFNLFEMIAREDRAKCLEVAKSITNYKKVYLNDKRTLFKYDIFRARTNQSNLNPFSEDIRSLIIYQSFETFIKTNVLNNNFSKAIMYFYDLDNNERIISTDDSKFYAEKNKLKDCIKQKEQRDKIIFKSINSKFLEYAESIAINLTIEERKKLGLLSPSFLIPFIIQLQLIISKGEKLLPNDLVDASHCIALPYVDLFVTDKGSMDRCQKALSVIDQHYRITFPTKIISNVKGISKMIN